MNMDTVFDLIPIIFVLFTVLLCPILLVSVKKIENFTPVKLNTNLSVVIIYRGDITKVKRLMAYLISRFYQRLQIIIVTSSENEPLRKLSEEYKTELVIIQETSRRCSENFFAYYMGAKKAVNNIILFTVSDICFSNKAINKMLRVFKKGRIVSVLSYRKNKLSRPFTGGYAVFWAMACGVFNIRKQKVPNLFTECMLIDRHDYFNVCTHEMIPKSENENVYFAKAYERAGIELYNYLGTSEVNAQSCDVYTQGQANNVFNISFAVLFILAGLYASIKLFQSVLLLSPSFVWAWVYVIYAIVYGVYTRNFHSDYLWESLLFPLTHIKTLYLLILYIIKGKFRNNLFSRFVYSPKKS